jgi:hypothetical protein
MPEVIVKCSDRLFNSDSRVRFITQAKLSVACNMDAINPATGEMTDFGNDPEKYIDFTMLEVAPMCTSSTTSCLLTVVTYGQLLGSDADGEPQYFWPDRMGNIEERLQAIVDELTPYVIPVGGKDAVSATFMGKGPGCWAVSS